MAGEFSTAGIKVYYSPATAIATAPTAITGFTLIPGIKATPDFNSEPSTLEVTDLSDPEYKRYIPGLKDLGGASAFTANLTSEFKAAWNALITAATAADVKNGTKQIWFEIAIPNFESFYFTGTPSPLGLGALEVDSVMEIDAYVTPNKVHGWGDASKSKSDAPITPSQS